MFIHNFKYTLKILLRNKALIFWTFAFPIILGTFFKLAFSNITESEKLSIIDIAIINNDEFNHNPVFKNTFESLSNPDAENRLFNTTYTTLDDAKELLAKDKIIGYLELTNNNPKIIFNSSGVDQTIFKYVTEEVLETSHMLENLSSELVKKELSSGNYNLDYDNITSKIKTLLEEDINLKNLSNNNLDYVMIEFYTLIAMTCLYGGILGMFSINQSLPNMSSKGKRLSITKTKKSTVIMSSLLASYLIQLIGLFILFIYTIYGLKVDYSNNLSLIILLSCVGSLAGLSLGIFIGSVIKTTENTKTGLLLAITMLGCFLSGMMGITMKYLVDKNFPIINKLNPANMITDGFYALYYYDTLNRYWFNIISLLILTFILLLTSSISLRRQKYDSI